jgi:hypothetical protein
MAEFTASQLRKALEDTLVKSGTELDSGGIQTVVTAAAAELAHPDAPQSEARRRLDQDILKPDVVYAVPDDALNLFPALVQAAVAAFGKGPIAALPDLVSLLFRFRALRVPLTAEEAAVLRVLKRAKTAQRPALAPADIEDALKKDGLAPKQKVGELLASLAAKKTEKATLVRETDGRWTIGNV